MSAPVVGLGRIPTQAPAQRRLGSLLVAADEGDTSPDPRTGNPRWLRGVEDWPMSAPGYRLAGDQGEPKDYGIGEGALPVGARPFLVQTFVQCPRGNIDELAARATAQLDAVTSQAVAHELWSGELTADNPWTLPVGVPSQHANPRPDSGTDPAGPWLNPHLLAVTGDDMWTGAPHPAAAVGRVEAMAMARVAGGPVFIHVPPELLLELSQFGIHPNGDVLYTPLGNVVVADAGYGSAVREPGDPLAVYATGRVQVWVGEPSRLDRPEQIVDTDNNQVGVWAERPALYVFDPQTAVGCTIEET